MPCLAIRRWTFSGLVGAFLDLSITFLLLCASTLAYFASKFLAVFGLHLPCPCTGFFAIPDSDNNCLQRQFIDYPLRKISSIQSSVNAKFPFDSIGNRSQWKCKSNIAKIAGVGSEGESSSSCISTSSGKIVELNSTDLDDLVKMKEHGFVMGAISSRHGKEPKFEFKWKSLPRHRSKNNLRRRKKGVVDNRKLLHALSFKSIWSSDGSPQSDPQDLNNCRDGNEGNSMVDIGSKRKISQGFELYESVDENDITDQENNSELHGNSRNTIKLLELALEEEHAARAVLYIELEKERTAASTAADEAMAMIQRLQEEKASLEMEAMQSQRMIEEKYAYDAEEMNILKEILIRREREKYYLEKEVEAYRQMLIGNEEAYMNTYGYCNFSDEDYKAGKSKQASINGDDVVPEYSDEEIIPSSATLKLIESPSSSSPENSNSNQDQDDSIHDVHVIDDQSTVPKQLPTKLISQSSVGLPPIPSSSSRTRSTSVHGGLRPDMRRKSMSAFDSERFKIGSEISWLRERLRTVQEGREKIKICKGNKERENTQLQILEDITSHLKDIRQLTEPGKAARRASLPPISSNVMSKKRRWRSGPLLLEGSV
ncbi:uncharacterized protein LOC126670773 [Mercurialis annua]|uniref:uncharacterized protein LOC126670773 n=1 Tax=Mercurialis annua TaxID=3986 RepID=UPI00215E6E25|nr:uncharacterized protein LOC126670773 [Mercurialis annua]